jgi:hypothetical protein
VRFKRLARPDDTADAVGNIALERVPLRSGIAISAEMLRFAAIE